MLKNIGMISDKFELGSRIRLIRTAFGYTQTQLCRLLQIPQTSLSAIESGKYTAPKEVIPAIAELTKINRGWIETGAGSPFIPSTSYTLNPALNRPGEFAAFNLLQTEKNPGRLLRLEIYGPLVALIQPTNVLISLNFSKKGPYLRYNLVNSLVEAGWEVDEEKFLQATKETKRDYWSVELYGPTWQERLRKYDYLVRGEAIKVITEDEEVLTLTDEEKQVLKRYRYLPEVAQNAILRILSYETLSEEFSRLVNILGTRLSKSSGGRHNHDTEV